MGYFQLLCRYPRTVGFGLLNSFFSGLGQTHFISLFSPYLMGLFALTNTRYGSIYSAVTLASGLVLPFLGPLIDKKDVRYFCFFVGLGLIACELSLANVSSITALAITLFGLRLFGQGLASHVSGITIARYFDQNRGKALGITLLGYPIYEGIITPLFAYLMTHFDWQHLCYFLALVTALIYIPSVLLMTKNIPNFNKPNANAEKKNNSENITIQKHWTRKEVFLNSTIYFLLLQSIMPPFALTGLFFHQAAIGAMKGWSLSLMATGLVFFAAGRSLTTFIAGPLVDKYKAKTLYPYYQIPLALGFAVLAYGSSPWVPGLCFALFGLAVGCGAPIKSSIWAELYGTQHLGAIKSAFATLMVISTAASPALFGWILDTFSQPKGLLLVLAGTSLFAASLSYLGLRNH